MTNIHADFNTPISLTPQTPTPKTQVVDYSELMSIFFKEDALRNGLRSQCAKRNHYPTKIGFIPDNGGSGRDSEGHKMTQLLGTLFHPYFGAPIRCRLTAKVLGNLGNPKDWHIQYYAEVLIPGVGWLNAEAQHLR